MNDYDPVIQALDAEFAERRERVRQLLYEQGRPDLVVELDRKYRENDLGLTGARDTWHSISDAQRRALRVAGARGRLSRVGKKYLPILRAGISRPIRVRTIRALCAHELLAWDGGASDPEAAAVITERGLFVLRHGWEGRGWGREE